MRQQGVMNDAALAVLREIEAAFPTYRAARFEPMVNSVQGDEPMLTESAFSDKDDWTSLDSKWLDEAPDGWATALSFLSNEAICFYIPAYMVADLRGQLERVEPAFHLTHGFDDFSRDNRIWPGHAETWTDYGRERWSHLTATQAQAVVHYLEWRIERDGLDLAYTSQQALSAFWYDRASVERQSR